MTLYLANGNVYTVGGDGLAHPTDVTAKDKVIEVRELESVTVSPQKKTVKLPEGAVPVTTDELIRKFGLSEKNPIKFKASRGKKAKEPAEKQEPAEPEEPIEAEEGEPEAEEFDFDELDEDTEE